MIVFIRERGYRTGSGSDRVCLELKCRYQISGGKPPFLTCEDADGSIQTELSHLIGLEGWLALASYCRLDVLH